jgi:hypothetical protein
MSISSVPGAGRPADSALSAGELVDRIRGLEELKAQASAEQARLTARLDKVVRAAHRDARLPYDQQGRGVASQVALARRESPFRGSRHLGLATALTTDLTCTLAAMELGQVSEWRATLIARETACLAAEDRRSVDAWLCAAAKDGSYRFEGWGDRRLVAELQRRVSGLDPRAVVNRRARAEADRRVSIRPAPDTMAQVSAVLPAAQGVSMWATLSRVADQLVASGDGRSRGQIMADTLVERVTGLSAAAAVPVTVNLVVSDDALLDDGREPARLEDYGPILADAARDLALSAAADGAATLRRLYAAPDPAGLVAMESSARYFPDSLAQLLRLRDRSCRTPWCDAPIRQSDHVAPHAAGGVTSAANGQGLCQQCNLAKQAPGWRSRPITGPPHTVETTTPTGHTVRSVAPPAPTPTALRRRRRADIWFPDIRLVA